MTRSLSVGLVGNYDATILAHQAIPGALRQAAETLDIEVTHEWVPTEEIRTTERIAGFDGLWCIPGSPYRSMEGALLAIRHAREHGIPFLGTCGGFQHAVIEFARNVLGWADAAHGESDPDAERAVIAPLTCGLLNSEGIVRLQPGSRLASSYGSTSTAEQYLCRYGVNPRFLSALVGGPMRVAATDESGDVRAVELYGHPFFVATLFQPERAALQRKVAPIVVGFVRVCAK
jgi:CTP synthase (UTP-ammonia lyase)